MRRLCTVPGVGPVTAGAVLAFAPDLKVFSSGRNFAAWLGLVPRQRSTGGKTRLGAVSKMGQNDIRRLLIVGAMSRIRWIVRKGVLEQVTAQKLRRDETGRQIEELRRQLASGAPTITPEKIERVARLLNDKLHHGPPDLRQAYARLMLDEVRVTKEEIRITGSKLVLARAASEGVDMPAPAVLSFVQEWRARKDSNL